MALRLGGGVANGRGGERAAAPAAVPRRTRPFAAFEAGQGTLSRAAAGAAQRRRGGAGVAAGAAVVRRGAAAAAGLPAAAVGWRAAAGAAAGAVAADVGPDAAERRSGSRPTLAAGGVGGERDQQTGSAMVQEAMARAGTLDARHLPYLWGGGHGGKVGDVANTGPLDCSGAVSAVLGIDPRVSGRLREVRVGGPRRRRQGHQHLRERDARHHVDRSSTGKERFFGTSQSNRGWWRRLDPGGRS
jgi:hypothetical protein